LIEGSQRCATQNRSRSRGFRRHGPGLFSDELHARKGRQLAAFFVVHKPLPGVSDFVLSECGVSAAAVHTFGFLDSGEQEPHGYEEIYAGVDLVVIGRNAFEVVQTFGKWPYRGSRY
jgi:hypothetical protein